MRSSKKIIKALIADNRHILSATNEEIAELILAIREEVGNNKLQLTPLQFSWLSDVAYRLASDNQRKKWGEWATNLDKIETDLLDISSAAASLGRKGGSATSDAKKKSSAENGKKGGRPKGSVKKENKNATS